MKIIPRLFTFGVAGTLAATAFNARADLEVSASVTIHATADFNAPLSACGTWVEAGSYGRCWRPAGVVVGWRPYCDGSWVWTDCGWYWASDEPWAWACYHYGHWMDDDTYGWVWVPGVEWAPAWVSWRVGGGFVGWAPLPPPGFFFARRPVDAAFVFVDADHFTDRIERSRVVVNNPAIFKRTKYISDVKPVTRDLAGVGSRRVIVNEGPGLAVMEKVTGKRFKPLSIREAVDRTPLPQRPAPRDEIPAPPDEKNNRPPEKHPPGAGPPAPGGPFNPAPGGGGPKQGADHGHGHGHDHGHGHGDF